MKVGKRIFILCIGLLLIISGCSNRKKDISSVEVNNQDFTPVRIAEVIQDNISERVSYSGKLIPKAELSINNKIFGTVTKINFDVGDPVKAGDTLFVIDDRDIASSIADLKNQIKSAEVALELQQTTYDQSKDQYEKKKALLEVGAISQNDFTKVETEYKKAEKQIKQSKLNIERLEIALEGAKNKLSDTIIKSPITGLVNKRQIQEGEIIGNNTSAFEIVQLDEVFIDVQVSQESIYLVKTSEAIEVHVDALVGKTFDGEFKYISPAADDKNLNYQARIKIDNNDKLLQPGMLCRVYFNISSSKNTILVTSESVIEKDGKKVVFIVGDDGLAHAVEVETGIENERYIEILKGINADDTIIIKGQEYLEDKDHIQIVEDE
ncbi:efflux RND transporter periplasmic adaptor subunit [Wukongibacter baidiensis]|uniref:efflux RND transporter periplasmic adaptor subunit n=1 Tax=Wukongibacter baidiensis TaxID=1723361 RepID=UPI003D7FDB28